MDKQETLRGVKQARQILAESAENGFLDGTTAWRLQRALQIAEGAVVKIPGQDKLFQGIRV